MDPRDHVAGLVLTALFSTLLGAPDQTFVDAEEAAMLEASIQSVVVRVH